MAEYQDAVLVLTKVKKGKKTQKKNWTVHFEGDRSPMPLPNFEVCSAAIIGLSAADRNGCEVKVLVEEAEIKHVCTLYEVPGDNLDDVRCPVIGSKANQMGKVARFHNPYNFVPALPREQVRGDLGDSTPAGHHRFHANRFSGRIMVKMTTVTPLLTLETSHPEEREDDHKYYRVLKEIGPDGLERPLLRATSVKGMLRSAYEAVTNSRLGVFNQEKRQAFRASTTQANQWVPARIEGDKIVLMTGTHPEPVTGGVGEMYAAWLPRWQAGKGLASSSSVKFASGNHPEHRAPVEAWAWRMRRTLMRPHRADLTFVYWRIVGQIVPWGGTLPAVPPAPPTRTDTTTKKGVRTIHEPEGKVPTPIKIKGFVCAGGPNAANKHDERVFFFAPSLGGHTAKNPVTYPLTPDLRTQWKDLAQNYLDTNEKKLKGLTNTQCSDVSKGPVKKAAFSRHVCNEEKDLEDGDLCYAEVNQINGQWEVNALFPVMLSRVLYPKSPAELLPTSLHPASRLQELSPADRVFGWVRQQGDEGKQPSDDKEPSAYKGNLRVGRVVCQQNCGQAVEDFGAAGLPLAILGQPKTAQGRFYVGQSQENPIAQETPKSNKEKAGYRQGRGLRGRKVYPHHRHVEMGSPLEQEHNYWGKRGDYKELAQEPLQQGKITYYREFIRTDGKGSSQNRSVEGWVKPGVEFRFPVTFRNLSRVELGALLWLFNLEQGQVHRLGLGKPLGFGSVRLDMEEAAIADGQAWRGHYADLANLGQRPVQVQSQGRELINRCMDEFEQAVEKAYPQEQGFKCVPFIRAFLTASRGFRDEKPIHYPRSSAAPNPEGKNFDWFMANEQVSDREVPKGYYLGNLADEVGLPILVKESRSKPRKT